jgi:hypothetical protein
VAIDIRIFAPPRLAELVETRNRRNPLHGRTALNGVEVLYRSILRLDQRLEPN